MKETDNQIRLRRAKEALTASFDKQTEARNAYNRAIDATRIAKERYEQLFLEEERQEAARRLKQ